jgi:DNA-binding MarR family transcriptional regulator
LGLLLLETTDVVNNERPAVTRVRLRGGARDEEAEASDSGERARRKPGALDLGVLNGHLGYFVRRFQVWIFQDFVRALAPFDIRPAQFSVLVVIDANAGLSQADLADTLGIERARLVRLLDGLEKRSLIRRLPSPTDRRSHALFLTREAQQKLKRIKALAAAHEARVEAVLGPEQRNQMLIALKGFNGPLAR